MSFCDQFVKYCTFLLYIQLKFVVARRLLLVEDESTTTQVEVSMNDNEDMYCTYNEDKGSIKKNKVERCGLAIDHPKFGVVPVHTTTAVVRLSSLRRPSLDGGDRSQHFSSFELAVVARRLVVQYVGKFIR